MRAGVWEVTIRHAHVQPDDLLQAALQYGLRTRERALIDDASSDSSYSGDEIRETKCHPIRSLSSDSQAL